LIFGMRVLCDDVTVGEIGSDARHVAQQTAVALAENAAAPMRHLCHSDEMSSSWQALLRKVKQVARRQAMLASGELVGLVAATDYDNARAFYEGNLGFEFVSLDRHALVMRAGEYALRISKLPFTPREARSRAGRCRTLKARPPGSTTTA
jgi:hypothetical protein